MQQRNFVVFLILSMAIFFGWMYVQNQLWPPPAQKAKTKDANKDVGQKELAEPEARPWAALSTGDLRRVAAEVAAPAAPAFAGAGEVARLATRLLTAEDAARLARKAAQQAKVAAAAEQQGKRETVVLGGDGYFLRAVLTTHGAGVQKLTLREFQSADWFGQPVFQTDEQGKRVAAPLDLIPDNPFNPSFRLFHYPPTGKDHNADVDRPLPDLAEVNWKLEQKPDATGEAQSAVFTAPAPAPFDHLRLRKTYTLEPRWYHLGLKLEVEDTRGEDEKGEPTPEFRYQLAGPHCLHTEGVWYSYLNRQAMIGMVDRGNYLWRSLEPSQQVSFRRGGNKHPAGLSRGSDALQYAAVTTQYFTSAIVVNNEQPPEEQGGVNPRDILAYARPTVESAEKYCRLDDFDLDRGQAAVTFLTKDARTTAELHLLPQAAADLRDKDFKPGDQILANVATALDGKQVAIGFRLGTVPKDMLDDLTVRVVSEPVALEAGRKQAHDFLLYHGPVKVRQLDLFSGDPTREVPEELVARYAETLHLETLTDYPSEGFIGWISQKLMWTDLLIYLTKWMHWLLNGLYYVVRNEGLAIILLTVIVRGLMFPVSRRQALMSIKMQELAPEMKKLQEKYKNDLQARQQATMELYRKHNVNPVSGCLPLFLQLPVFLSLYYCLQESIRFRLAPLLWIPNLAAPDMLFPWGQGFPWLTDPDNLGGMLYLGPYFNLLPVVAISIMMVQQALMMPPPTDEQQEVQQKMMKYMMVFMGVLFYKVAAGLVIYFIASGLWGLAERQMLPKKKKDGAGVAETPARAASAPASGKPGKKRGKGGPPPREQDPRIKKVRDWWEEVLKQAKKK